MFRNTCLGKREQGMNDMFLIEDIIDVAIQLEKNAEKVYRKAHQKIANPELAAMLDWLADEEVKHAAWFSDLRSKIRKKIVDSEIEKMGRELLQQATGTQSFSLDEADFSEMRQVRQLLDLAIEYEKDTVVFYGMLQPFIEDEETLDFLEKIIAEEKSHIQRLRSFFADHRKENMAASESS